MKTVAFNRLSLSILVAAAALGGTACDKGKTDDAAKPVDPVTQTAASDAASPASPTGSGETHAAMVDKPASAKDPMKAADGDMKKVLEQLGALGGKPIPSLTPAEARKQPTPTDAVMALLKKDGKDTAPIEMAKVENKKIPGAAGTPIDVRIYTPKVTDKKPLPVVVYYHGGGFVIADLDTYDASPRALAKGANAIVVSADYRRAPEAKFPAQHDDAYAAYEWAVKNAASFGGDPKRIAVAGESAGGNLAANVSIMAKQKNGPIPVHQLLVYPVAQTSTDTKSYQEWENGKPLDKAMMLWFVDKAIKSPADKEDPRLNLVKADLTGSPRTTIVLAEIDPLKSDGDLLAKKLEDSGVAVDKKVYEGVTHEFFGMGAVVSDAKDAESYAAGRLKDAFAK